MSTNSARLAAAAAVVGVAALVGTAGVWMIGHAPDAADTAADDVPGVTAIANLGFGDCYAIPRDAQGSITTAAGVYVVACDKEHDGQVLQQVQLADLDWAGSVPMKASAQNQCATAFNRYKASMTDTTGLFPGYFLPSEKQWQAGNRTITCTVTMDKPFTGTRI